MLKRNMLAVAVCSSFFMSVGVSAAVQKDKEQGSDSVHTWGPWNGVQTAAGPGTPGSVPLSLQFADAQNATEGSDFEAGFTGEGEAREYHVYRKRGKYEQAFFDGLELTDNPDNQKDQLKFSLTTENGKKVSANFKRRNAIQSDSASFENRWTFFEQQAVFEADDETPAFYIGEWSKKRRGQSGNFVYGDSSPIIAVLELPQGIEQVSALASYSGYFLNSHGSVDIEVDFSGQGSWSGSFALDGYEFDVANGAINGVDLTGSAIGESVVTGQVEASFFGAKAQYINGIADVDFGEEQIIDVFVSSNPQGELPVIEVPDIDLPK